VPKKKKRSENSRGSHIGGKDKQTLIYVKTRVGKRIKIEGYKKNSLDTPDKGGGQPEIKGKKESQKRDSKNGA